MIIHDINSNFCNVVSLQISIYQQTKTRITGCCASRAKCSDYIVKKINKKKLAKFFIQIASFFHFGVMIESK